MQHTEVRDNPERFADQNRYGAIISGLKDYWYPVTWAKNVKEKKPFPIRMLDQDLFLIRENGKVFALSDRCPHRGVALSTGRQEFPGTWACKYHGWVFDLQSGVLKAVITDGPDSPMCGKARVRTYPVEERLGLLWVYIGEGTPPAVEADIPEELFHPDVVMVGRISLQKGNWRYGCENAFDEGHYKYLHRYGVLFSLFQEFPAWSAIKVIEENGGWITRDVQTMSYGEADYNGLGAWPPKFFWKRRGGKFRLSMRLPAIMRNRQTETPRTNYSWYVPVGAEQYRYLQFYTMRARGWAALKFKLYFYLYLRWVHFIQFNNQDIKIVAELKESTPARLYRPDESIFAWRRLCASARQFTKGMAATAVKGPAVKEPV